MSPIRLFIDTNVFVEYFEKRRQFESVKLLFNRLEEGIYEGYISGGSFYTIAYIVDRGFRKKGIHGQERLDCVRLVMKEILDLVKVINIDNEKLLEGVNDITFSDMEDSFQYQTALYGDCEYIITLNTKDFCASNRQLKVYMPQQFVEEKREIPH